MAHSAKKTASGNGNIRKKTVTTKGKEYTYWEARFTIGFDPGTGKQIQKSVSGSTQKEVRKKMHEALMEIDTGTYTEPCKMTFAEWLDIWESEYLGGVKPRTMDSYNATIRCHIRPTLGNLRLDSIKATEIQRLYNSLQRQDKPLSAKTIKNIHGVIHKALQQALELGYIKINPANACKLPRIEKAMIQPLDDIATKAFLQAIQGHNFENIFLVTLFTGMREGEVLGLTWDCVDFNRETILIGKQLQRKRDGSGQYTLISPKNGKHRKVAPATFVMDVLKRQKEKQAELRRLAGNMWIESNFVFTNEIGENLSPQTVYLNFKKLVAAAGYPDARFHDLRHSYAVAALQSGDDIKTVQENLGHHTAAFTLDIYGHVTDKMRRDSAQRMQVYIDSLQNPV